MYHQLDPKVVNADINFLEKIFKKIKDKKVEGVSQANNGCPKTTYSGSLKKMFFKGFPWDSGFFASLKFTLSVNLLVGAQSN